MITLRDIDNLAELARLELSAEEKAGFEKDLNSILTYVGEVQNITAELGDSDQPDLTRNTMRDDIVTIETGAYTRSLVDAAPTHDKDYIKVKKILG